MSTEMGVMIGLVVGAGLVLVVFWLRRSASQRVAQQLAEQAAAQRVADLEAWLEKVRAAFGELSQQALTRSNEQFLQLAETRLTAQARQQETTLDARKRLIDEAVKQIETRLTEVRQSLQTLERDRREAQGKLEQRLDLTTRVTSELQQTTSQLRAALANPQRRGQWGERMAEDVLRLAGFIDGLNYVKQASESGGGRPDFTFMLPQDRRVNMDVKFPAANYLRYLDAGDDATREQFRVAFLRDVRNRIHEVTGREYIDTDGGTLDWVLVFIPNEQIYGFIHEHDPELLDDALRQKVVLCSPLTLYAVLAVIRQAAENFRVERAAREILALLGTFRREWGKYTEVVEKLGKSIEQAHVQFEALSTTRTRKLERQLDQIEALRSQEQIALPPEELADK